MNANTKLEDYTQAELKVLNWCRELSYSQGFYGRLYVTLRENREFLQELANQNFTEMLDFILYVEQ